MRGSPRCIARIDGSPQESFGNASQMIKGCFRNIDNNSNPKKKTFFWSESQESVKLSIASETFRKRFGNVSRAHLAYVFLDRFHFRVNVHAATHLPDDEGCGEPDKMQEYEVVKAESGSIRKQYLFDRIYM